MTKKYLIFSLIIFLTGGFYSCDKKKDASLLPEDIQVNSQEELNRYKADYEKPTIIYGDLLINDFEEGEPIQDIDFFSELKEITGKLLVKETSLIDLSTFSNLQKVNGIDIYRNDELQEVLFPKLTTLNKLDSTFSIRIHENARLKHAELTALTEVDGQIDLRRNELLESMVGSNSLEYLEKFNIRYNEIFRSLSGFESVKEGVSYVIEFGADPEIHNSFKDLEIDELLIKLNKELNVEELNVRIKAGLLSLKTFNEFTDFCQLTEFYCMENRNSLLHGNQSTNIFHDCEAFLGFCD